MSLATFVDLLTVSLMKVETFLGAAEATMQEIWYGWRTALQLIWKEHWRHIDASEAKLNCFDKHFSFEMEMICVDRDRGRGQKSKVRFQPECLTFPQAHI
jgi:hypothetical protein